MGDDITIGVTEIVNNIEVTAQPNDQIVDISVIDNTDEVTLNITPTVIEINVNKGSSYAKWGTILGTLSDQEDLQDALDLKADLVDGKVPSSQLPSYVDDVIEVANYAALPTVGESGKIYITLDDNHIFRWTGSTYVEITDNTAVWGAITGTLSSQTDLQSALNLKANDNAVVHLTGNESISGQKTFANTIYAIGGTGSGEYAIEIDKSFEGEAIRVKNASSTTFTLSLGGTVTASSYVKSGGTSSQFLKADGSVDSTSYQTALGYTPANDSNVVHLTGDETINGIKTFGNSTKFDYGINLKQDTTTAYFPNYTTIDGYSNGYIVNNGDARSAIFYLANNASRVYNFPDANGTFALTSDLSSAISGTTNYVPKFTSSNALGNSLIYDNGTNVFVGGSGSNGNRFTVVEGGTTLVGQQILMQNASSANDALNIVHSGTGKLIKGTKGVEVFNITNSGGAYFADKVGIGISSPTSPLHVKGSGAYAGVIVDNTGTTGGGYFAARQNGSQVGIVGVSGAIIGDTSSNMALFSETGKSVDFMTDGSATIKMRITSSGNVGIGTTSPTSYLDYRFLSLNGGDGAVYQLRKANTTFGEIGGDGTFLNIDSFSAYLKFSTGNTERMRITSGGNVGIGLNGASPTYKLEVVQTTTGTPCMGLKSTNSAGYSGIHFLNPSSGLEGHMGFGNSGTGSLANLVYFGSIASRDVVITTNDSERMRITSGGNVLINTSTDNGFRLRVEGSSWLNGPTYFPYVYGNTSGGSANVYISASGEIARATSSRKYKENIEDYTKGLDIIMQMRPVTYNSINENEYGIKYAGLIAEEIHDLGLTEFVQYAKDGTPDALYYANMVSLLVKGIQELKAEIEILKNK